MMFNLSETKTTLNMASLHFMVLWSLALMLMINWGEAYRAFAYLNFFGVIMYAISHVNQGYEGSYKKLLMVVAVPLGFTLLHILAVGSFELIKDVRHLWLVTFIVLSIWILARRDTTFIKQYLSSFIILLLVCYVIAQAIGQTFLLNPYGTNRNPHYLALYSSLSLPVALYICSKVQGWLRVLLISIVLALGYFVLNTSSRPAWIALLICGLMTLFFLKGRGRMLAAIFLIAIPAFLFFTNIASFGDRFTDLAEHLSSEERVVIWQDAWAMQMASNLPQWFYGHGLDSFREDFLAYSRYRGIMDFNSPHNSFLDVLYTSGLVGLGLFFGLYSWLYAGFFKLMRNNSQNKKIAGLLVILLTINFLFIMITIPFFAHYNLYTLAFIAGALIYLQEAAPNSNT